MNSTSDYIEQHQDAEPDRGPYSHSRMGPCPLMFKKDYVDKEEGTQLTRFGKSVGSAMHDLAELDVLMRIEHPPEDWLAPLDLVKSFVDARPEYQDKIGVLAEQLETFRFSFEINKQNYVASEQHIGVDLLMRWVDYDDPKCWFRGRIDYLEVEDSGLARVVDFKNYPAIHSNTQLNNLHEDVGCQLMGYVAMVMAMDSRIQAAYFEIYYFRYGTSRTPTVKDENDRPQRRIITREEVERWWKFNQRKMLVYERRQTFPAQPSQKACQYCNHVATCEWQQAKNPDEIIATSTDEAKDLTRRLLVLEEERDRIKNVVKSYTRQFGTLELENGVVCGPVPQERTHIDVEKFIEVCENLDIDPKPYLNVTKTNFDKLMKSLSNQEDREALAKAKSVKVGTRTKYG